MRKIQILSIITALVGTTFSLNFDLSQTVALAQSSNQPITWTKNQLSIVKKNCVKAMTDEFKKNNQKISAKFVIDYCDCVIEIAAQRYEIKDFGKNEQKYVEKFTKEGVIKKCLETAQSYN
jgi:hypothetical protein